MKLQKLQQLDNYKFLFTFENGEEKKADIADLVSAHLKPNELQSASINDEWGCLEFKGGLVDIEPKTLYNYCKAHSQPK